MINVTQAQIMFSIYLILSFVIVISLMGWITLLKKRIVSLQNVCGDAYQMAGALGASEKALDNLSAASQGDPIPHKTFLPVYEAEEITLLSQEIRKLEQEIIRLKDPMQRSQKSASEQLKIIHARMAGIFLEDEPTIKEVNPRE